MDLTSLNVTHFEQINLDHNFVLEHSETSDNRPYTTSDTSHTTTHKEQTSNTQPSYVRQQSEQSEQSEQESPTQETLVNLFKILILLRDNHNYKSLIYNSQILLKQIQFTIHQNFLKKQYKIHEVLQ